MYTLRQMSTSSERGEDADLCMPSRRAQVEPRLAVMPGSEGALLFAHVDV